MSWRDETKRSLWKRSALRLGAAAMVAGLVLGSASLAGAQLRLEGAWPEGDAPVSLDLDAVARRDALEQLADEAGWSLVLRDEVDGDVSLRIKQQPASKVLEALLADGTWVAKRDGAIVTISKATGSAVVGGDVALPTPPTPPTPPVPVVAPTPPVPPGELAVAEAPSKEARAKARDVEVVGGSRTIREGEVVRDLTVMGGSVDVAGHVTGDLTVMGGSAHLRSTARVDGDATTAGGHIKIDPGATVAGDVGAVGGVIEGADHASGSGGIRLDVTDDDEHDEPGFFASAARTVGSGVRSAALLFVLGAFFLALGAERSERLRTEIAARPMHSIALGAVGILGTSAALIVLAVTVIGIPFALIGALAAVVFGFAGVTSVLTVVGALAAGHRTSNDYARLAVGCALYFVIGLVPWVGWWAQLAVVLAGVGSVVATRGAGLLDRRSKDASGHPYR
jgi:hypothetical protein